MRKEKDWELEEKKEKLRWMWTAIVLVVAISAFFGNVYYQKYSETTVTKLMDRVVKDFSIESYNNCVISLSSNDIRNNKYVNLSKDDIANLMSQLDITHVMGIKDKDFIEQINDTYIVKLEADRSDKHIVLFIGQDKSSQEIILSMLQSNRYIADKYVVKGEELFNMLSNLVEKAP